MESSLARLIEQNRPPRKTMSFLRHRKCLPPQLGSNPLGIRADLNAAGARRLHDKNADTEFLLIRPTWRESVIDVADPMRGRQRLGLLTLYGNLPKRGIGSGASPALGKRFDRRSASALLLSMESFLLKARPLIAGSSIRRIREGARHGFDAKLTSI